MAFLSSLGVRVGLFGLMIVMLRSEGRMGGPAHVFPFPTSASAFSPDGRLKCPGFPPERESTTSPYARYHDLPWMRVRDWCLRFKRNILHPSRRGTELVFLGDSITEAWTEVAPDIWESYFGRYTPLKLGIPGDETQQVLWRIENGELDGLKPRVIVLLVGVNNLRNGEWSVAETAAGIEAVLHAIKKKVAGSPGPAYGSLSSHALCPGSLATQNRSYERPPRKITAAACYLSGYWRCTFGGRRSPHSGGHEGLHSPFPRGLSTLGGKGGGVVGHNGRSVG